MRPLYYIGYTVAPFYLIMSIGIALVARALQSKENEKPRLVWGPTPIINNKHWSKAMKSAGYDSTVMTVGFYSNINKRDDINENILERIPVLPLSLKLPLLFWESLFRFDVFVLSFDGWLLGRTPFWWMEAFLFRLASKKTILIPYGSDAYVYRNVRSISSIHALISSYPQPAKQQDSIEKKVFYWTKHADCLNPGVMGMDGIGRWDVLKPSSLCVDTSVWTMSKREQTADGTNDAVTIVHAPNHTGFKGTEFIANAIEILKTEGLRINFVLIQNIQNDEVQRIFKEDADILVEQLICTGHGINAVEGMACGLSVISNLEDTTYTGIFKRCSHLNECPIVSADPESILDQLRRLIKNPELRRTLGKAGRQYVEKYNSYPSTIYLFEQKIKYIFGKTQSILNLYHPLLGDYPKKSAYVHHPLIDNKIID